MFSDLIAPLFTTEWGKRTGWASLVAACAIFIYCLLAALQSVYHDAFLVSKAAKTVPIEAAKTNQGLLTVLPGLHLFGYLPDDRTPLPVTSLQLRLVGVIQAGPNQVSRVMISEGGQPSKIYKIGDVLPSGVKVQEITRDGVILENSGRLEKLPLQRPELHFRGMPTSQRENN